MPNNLKIENIVRKVIEEENSAFFFTPPIYPEPVSYVFAGASKILRAFDKTGFRKILNELDELKKKGKIALGYINYEAGYLLEERLEKYFRVDSEVTVSKFFVYEPENVQKIHSNEIDFSGVGNILQSQNFSIDNFKLNTSKEDYVNCVKKIRKYIAEGDTYQANYTVKGKFDFSGSFEVLFLNLVFNQSAKYTALINTGNKIHLSLSPELFFHTRDNEITASPMKGTIKRCKNSEEDSEKAGSLKRSKKDRAENVMILDLLRNDLGRISETGSVKVRNMFEIEKYESLFQMTSTVKSRLVSTNLSDIIPKIFPCGSITGAPKLRTMEIIKELESEARGIYSGSIGIAEKGKLIFNVAIRTLTIDKETREGELGIGSGIVWDSEPEKEYRETLLKANFLLKPYPYFEIFETLLMENGKIFLLELHLERMEKAADYFLFQYSWEKVLDFINELAQMYPGKVIIKLLLDKWGNLRYESRKYSDNPESVKVIISDKKIDSGDPFQYFKTTIRKTYDEELKKAKESGFFEVLFRNENNEITEGAVTNILIKKDGKYFTQPVHSGLLDGCYRRFVLENWTNVEEKTIYREDLKEADEVYLMNSVRKLVKVDEITDSKLS